MTAVALALILGSSWTLGDLLRRALRFPKDDRPAAFALTLAAGLGASALLLGVLSLAGAFGFGPLLLIVLRIRAHGGAPLHAGAPSGPLLRVRRRSRRRRARVPGRGIPRSIGERRPPRLRGDARRRARSRSRERESGHGRALRGLRGRREVL